MTRPHARVHVDHYMLDADAGKYRLLFNSQDLLQYLPQVRQICFFRVFPCFFFSLRACTPPAPHSRAHTASVACARR